LNLLGSSSGGVCIDGVRRLGVISSGVKRCEMRDSMAGDELSSEPTVCVSSLCTLVRIELSLVVDSCGLYWEHDDSERDCFSNFSMCEFRQ